MAADLKKLKEWMGKSVLKKGPRTASFAKSESGNLYFGAHVGSDTNLLDISAEQVALLRSVQNNDFGVKEVITMAEETEVSPINIKVIVDYAIRVQRPIKYKILNANGTVFFETADVSKEVPFYKKENVVLQRVTGAKEISGNKLAAGVKTEEEAVRELKKYASLAINRNFPTYDSASGYGSAVMTEDGFLYWSGQYSSFEKRTNIHSEMGAVISAIMDGRPKIAHLGVVSSKYPDSPVQMCGCCRQFLAEMAAKFEFEPKIYCFSKDTDEMDIFSLENYLPKLWSSKKWKK